MQTKNKSSQSGSSIVEFAITVPLWLLLFVGFVEFGRFLAEYGWFSQVSAQSAFIGSITPASGREARMQGIAQQIYGVKNENLEGFLTGFSENALERSFTFSMDADLKSILKFLPLKISVKTKSLDLTSNRYSLGDVESSENPSELFDCSGARISGCHDYSCAPASC